MQKLTEVFIKPLKNSDNIKPLRMSYTQNGNNNSWDFLVVTDYVQVIIYNTTRKVLIFVKQFRPAVYVSNIPESECINNIDVRKYKSKLGITVEICSQAVNENKPLTEIAAQKVLLRCGYKIDPRKLEKVLSYRTDIGRSGSVEVLYYCEVTDNMKVSRGTNIDTEVIDVIEMSMSDVKQYINQDHILSPPNFLFALYWFLSKLKE